MIHKTNNTSESELVSEVQFGDLKINQDLKHSILIVSLVANLFIFTTWITLQVTTQYDAQIASFLFAS
jgi:hypothetical protein